MAWNPADKAAAIVLSNADRTAAASSGWSGVRGVVGHQVGRWYCEIHADQISGAANGLVVGFADKTTTPLAYPGASPNSAGQGSGTTSYNNGAGSGGTGFAITGAALPGGDVIGLAFDGDLHTFKFYRNNTLMSTVTGVPALVFYPAVGLYDTGAICTLTVNPADGFAYSPPAGYEPWAAPVPADGAGIIRYTLGL